MLSSLVVEDIGNGDMKIHFAGLTGGYSAKDVLERDELITMEPKIEIELVFRSWEAWLQEAEICDSISQIDFIELHAFGAQPKNVNLIVDPEGFAAEQQRPTLARERGAPTPVACSCFRTLFIL